MRNKIKLANPKNEPSFDILITGLNKIQNMLWSEKYNEEEVEELYDFRKRYIKRLNELVNKEKGL